MAAPVPTASSAAVQSPPAVASPEAEAPKLYAKSTKAGHYEIGDDGQQKYIPKPAPDASQFALPPVRKDRVNPPAKAGAKPATTSGRGAPAISPGIVSPPPSNSRPVPSLPSRDSTNRVASQVSVSASPEAAGAHTDSNAQTQNKPVKFVDIDVNKFGPPPPRIYRGNEQEKPTSHESQPKPAASVPSPLPTAPDSKKVPPPKPSKPVKPPKPLFSGIESNLSGNAPHELPSSPPPPYDLEQKHMDKEEEVQPSGFASSGGVPNFAAQIAQLRSVNSKSPQLTGKSTPPPKPSKPAVGKKPETFSEIKSPPTPIRRTPEVGVPVSLPRGPSVESLSKLTKAPPPKPAKLHSRPSEEKKELPVKPKPLLKPKPQVVEPPVAPSVLPRRSPAPIPSPSKPIPVQILESASTPPPPPPPRNYSRAPALPPASATSPPDLDLELSSGWFANTTSPLQLPKALEGLNYSTSYLYATKTTPLGTFSDHSRDLLVTLKDLAKVAYRITWKNNDVSTATSEITKFVPSPIINKPLTTAELIAFSAQFGNYVAAWCSHNEGKQVGTGECWDLAKYALEKGCGKHAFVSTYYHHGYPILKIHGEPTGMVTDNGPHDQVRKGDILQFTTAKFEDRARGSTQTAGDPDHTSVVVDKIGERILVLEQNVQGVRVVRKGEYVLGNIVSGSVVVYRPVSAQWAE